jgi:Icc-related predicted phosphoesterase
VVVTPDEKAALDADPGAVEARFAAEVQAVVEEWVALADERLAGTPVDAFVMLGNDDEPELADVLRGSETLRYAEDGVLPLPHDLELVSWGYSPPTPWNTPRECDEDELAAALASRIAGLADPARAVFNFHVPPFDTHLDQAPRLDELLTPIVGPSGIEIAPVGSRAVRAAIEAHQPILGLHGHVHESAGVQDVGSTLCINPGSAYGEGVLRGAIVELDAERGRVRSWQLTEG